MAVKKGVVFVLDYNLGEIYMELCSFGLFFIIQKLLFVKDTR